MILYKENAPRMKRVAGLIDKNRKNRLVKSHMANSFDIWYVTSSSGLLQKGVKLCPEGEKGATRSLVGFT